MVVLSPDEGSVKRALRYQKKLNVNMAIVDKRRINAEHVENANLIGASLEGKVALIFDDMISTGGTVVSAANGLRDAPLTEDARVVLDRMRKPW